MEITPADIIEEIVDGLAMGAIGQASMNLNFERTGPGSLLLDFGGSPQLFTLTVEAKDRGAN
jgi:hypothetical protein